MTAAELREARQALGLSQAKMAARIGVSRRMYCYWETGEWPVPETVALAVKYLLHEQDNYFSR